MLAAASFDRWAKRGIQRLSIFSKTSAKKRGRRRDLTLCSSTPHYTVSQVLEVLLWVRHSDSDADPERTRHLPAESLGGAVFKYSQYYADFPTVGPWASYLSTLFFGFIPCKKEAEINTCFMKQSRGLDGLTQVRYLEHLAHTKCSINVINYYY